MNYEELMNNIDIITKNYNERQLLTLSKTLKYEQRLNFHYKIDCYLNNKPYNEIVATYNYQDKFIKKLENNNELEYIVKNIHKIIKNSSTLKDTPLLYLKQNENKISKDDLNKIEATIAKSTSMYYPNIKKENLDKLTELLKNTAREEGTTLLDIRYMNYGAYSEVFRIKSKIIKVGYTRECPNIPENNRILIPYFKGNIGSDFIEINDYINSIDSITNEDVYTVYKDIRDEGLIWLDPGKENIAKVSNDILSKINLRRKNLTDKGIIKNNNHIPETKDILLIDLDHIVFENDLEKIEKIRRNLSEGRNATLDRLENRYSKETKKAKVLKKTLLDYLEYY